MAAGNFSLTAALAQAAALLVAPHLPHREIIDYASDRKRDAPERHRPRTGRAPRSAAGGTGGRPGGGRPPEARGATIAGTQVHSLRLPSFAVSTEVIFALPDERLVIRHDAGGSATPYVAGTLMAVRAARQRTGLVRGLDTLLLGR